MASAKKTPAKKSDPVLATDVHVRDDNGARVLCKAGTTPENELAEKITHPAAWVNAD